MTKFIHGGDKENFKTALQYDIQNTPQNSIDKLPWDGHLSSSDLLDVLKRTPGKNKRKSVLDEYCEDGNSKRMRLSAERVISMVDVVNGYNLIEHLRKQFPVIFPSFKLRKPKGNFSGNTKSLCNQDTYQSPHIPNVVSGSIPIGCYFASVICISISLKRNGGNYGVMEEMLGEGHLVS